MMPEAPAVKSVSTQSRPVPDTVTEGVDVPALHALKSFHLRALHVEVEDVLAHVTLHQFAPRYMHGLLEDAPRIICEPLRHVASPAKIADADTAVPETGVQLMLFTNVSVCTVGTF